MMMETIDSQGNSSAIYSTEHGLTQDYYYYWDFRSQVVVVFSFENHYPCLLSQSSDQDLNTGLSDVLYELEARSKDLTNCEEYQQQTSRRIKRNTKYDHFSGSYTLEDYVENQTPGQRFEFEVFVVIIDNVLSAITKRMKAYHNITSVFEVFRLIKSLATEEILKKSSRMFSAYEDDLENGELAQFVGLLKTDVATVSN